MYVSAMLPSFATLRSPLSASLMLLILLVFLASSMVVDVEGAKGSGQRRGAKKIVTDAPNPAVGTKHNGVIITLTAANWTAMFNHTMMIAMEPAVPLDEKRRRNEAGQLAGGENEWLVMFHSPYCETCRAYYPTYQLVADWAESSNRDRRVDPHTGAVAPPPSYYAVNHLHIAAIDVAKEPYLQGLFGIIHLPCLYHIRKGEVRHYEMSRNLEEVVAFLADEHWRRLEPLAWANDPRSWHLTPIGYFFVCSAYVKGLQMVICHYCGLPHWLAFIIIVLMSIVTLLFIGYWVFTTTDWLQCKYAASRWARCARKNKKKKKKAGGSDDSSSEDLDVNDSDFDEDDDEGDDAVVFERDELLTRPSSAEQVRHRRL